MPISQSVEYQRVNIDNGWLKDVRRIPSPNANERPPGCGVDLLVVHNISLPPGEFGTGYIEQLFTNCLDCTLHPWFEKLRDLTVSAHLLIDRRGRMTQFVPFHLRAWHAGASCFEGRENCNDFSIGLELEGADDIPYTSVQYARLAQVSLALMREYPGIDMQRIVGHSDIAPGRKSDPGVAFDWDRYRETLAKISRSVASRTAGGVQ